MSFQIVSERLAILQESNAQLKELINRLANIKFQPGSVPLGEEDDNVNAELAGEIQQTIKDQDEELKILQEDVIELPPARQGTELDLQKNTLDRGVKRASEELNQLIIEFRKAQLVAKKSLQEAQRLERELIVKSYLEPKPADHSLPVPGKGRKGPSSQDISHDEKTVNASSDVTLALRRTHDMMAAELSRSQFAHEALQQSTQALAELGETYSTLDTLLSSSKNLLGTLLRSQKSDTWYLETAFYVLAVTIAWLVFRRFLYGPAWWLLYLPLKVVFRAWVGVFTALGLVGGLKDVAASSIAGEGPSIIADSVSQSIISSSTPSIAGSSPSGTSSIREADRPHGQGSVSDQVGRIIDEGQNHGHDSEGDREIELEEAEDQPKIQKNPKKRMWEEDKEAQKEEQRKKDEL